MGQPLDWDLKDDKTRKQGNKLTLMFVADSNAEEEDEADNQQEVIIVIDPATIGTVTITVTETSGMMTTQEIEVEQTFLDPCA